MQYLAPDETTHLAVIAADSNGCSAIDRLIINLLKPRKVFVPNAFSPNGDGANDILTIFGGPDVLLIRNFVIFDRWGNQVFGRQTFQPNDPTFGWDGNFKGRPMNTAVYAFLAEIEFVDGWVEIFEGDVVLMR
ncbi:MAG: gliding motility-associated C-terminal domain-containing protein [Saprospiraceae bacterium]|nr:gliding motility-associated C-terminal domain-containing protein [Saprospiraceae bacterium]